MSEPALRAATASPAADQLLRPLNKFADAADKPCLICLPYAGGSDRIFRPWAAALADAEVGLWAARLPGRAERVMERPYTEPDELMADLATETIARVSGRPFALYGHSMGAAVACALAQLLDRRHGIVPARLFVAAHAAPQSARPWLDALGGDAAQRLADDEFIAWLREFGLADAAVLANAELAALVLPGLRADFALVRAHHARPQARTTVPLSVFGGRSDPLVDATALGAWSDVSDAPATVRVFPGGHLFPWEHPEVLLPVLVRDVASCLTTPRAEA
jgi:medium-chain acyl-[acyl-carrier-protein] hydrolase